MTRILLVEDEPIIASALQYDLALEGHDVTLVGDGLEASRRAREEPFDLIVLDAMLPGRDGFDVCRDVRKAGLTTPILMLTARAQETEKVLAFELGADDYVTKPFGTMELRARIKALLRRSELRTRDEATPTVARFGNVEIDLAQGWSAGRRDHHRVQAARHVREEPGPRAHTPAAPRCGLGPRIRALRPRGGQPHRQPAAEARSRPHRTAPHRQRPRPRLSAGHVMPTKC
jgi:CheY-like chemotaxis protein